MEGASGKTGASPSPACHGPRAFGRRAPRRAAAAAAAAPPAAPAPVAPAGASISFAIFAADASAFGIAGISIETPNVVATASKAAGKAKDGLNETFLGRRVRVLMIPTKTPTRTVLDAALRTLVSCFPFQHAQCKDIHC